MLKSNNREMSGIAGSLCFKKVSNFVPFHASKRLGERP